MSWDPIDWPMEDLVVRHAEGSPDRTALVHADDDLELTYRDLHGRAERTAASLSDRGVEPGDTVGLLLTTGLPVVELFHAAMRLGATLVPLNVELTAADLSAQAQLAAVDWLVCESGTEATAVDVVDPGRVLAVHRDPGHDEVGQLGRATASAGDRNACDGDPDASGDDLDASPGDGDLVGPDWTQLVMFTSGTTGEPKGVRITAGNLVASARASASRLGVAPDDRWLVCLPTYHMGGIAPVLRSALYGTAVVLQPKFDAEATREVVERRAVTGVSLVPTMLVRLLDAGWEPPEHLRFVLLGGAPASADLIDRCEDRGVPVHPTYGTTETASQIATATPEEAFEYEGTVGRPLECTEVAVLGDDGERLPAGEHGELVVDGPTVTPGYLDDEQTVAAFGRHGLHTGDVGYRDAGGRLWVLGRAGETIVTGGENVHPARIADAIREYPAVDDVAVVGLDDPEWGERIAALVVGEVAVEGLEAHCRERLAGFAIPKTWGVADRLPRTASGTVDREAVRDRLADD